MAYNTLTPINETINCNVLMSCSRCDKEVKYLPITLNLIITSHDVSMLYMK